MPIPVLRPVPKPAAAGVRPAARPTPLIQNAARRALQPLTPAVPASELALPAAAPARAPVMRAAVHARVAISVPEPAGLSPELSTNESVLTRFHCLIYGDTDARKTTVAAQFGPPDDVRIIQTRRKAQMAALEGMGYIYRLATTTEAIQYCLQFPEKVFGEKWIARADPILILDDLSYYKDLEAEANETETVVQGGVETERDVRDPRRIARGVKATMWDSICRGVLKKDIHFIATALERSWLPNPKEERIGPDVPPGVFKLLGAEFEFCFYVDKAGWRFRTEEYRRAIKHTNEKGYEETWTQVRFAKHKVRLGLAGKGVIRPEEPMDLRELWERLKAGRAAATGAAVARPAAARTGSGAHK